MREKGIPQKKAIDFTEANAEFMRQFEERAMGHGGKDPRAAIIIGISGTRLQVAITEPLGKRAALELLALALDGMEEEVFPRGRSTKERTC